MNKCGLCANLIEGNDYSFNLHVTACQKTIPTEAVVRTPHKEIVARVERRLAQFIYHPPTLRVTHIAAHPQSCKCGGCFEKFYATLTATHTEPAEYQWVG